VSNTHGAADLLATAARQAGQVSAGGVTAGGGVGVDLGSDDVAVGYLE